MATKQYVTRVHRQHSSLVTTMPLRVRSQLELTKGDHIVWTVDENSNFVQISNLVQGVCENVRDKRNSGGGY